MTKRFFSYLPLALIATVLVLVFLAYLRPAFLLEWGTRLQLC